MYNLCHASARNVVERIFGVLKHCFVILVHSPEYSMEVQARIPIALGATHNFICDHDQDEILEILDLFDPQPGLYGNLSDRPARQAKIVRATSR